MDRIDSSAVLQTSVELQSLVNTHQHPFVVIDADYRICAVNHAYEQAYHVQARQVIGNSCHEISHHSLAPCAKAGEDCPHQSLYQFGKPTSCVHHHVDVNNCPVQVRVSAFPLHGSDGKLYMGELIEEIGPRSAQTARSRRMVGSSQLFMACIQQLKVVSATDAPVLLQGETGTGKDLAARYIHLHSPRREQPFHTVDCTVLTESLFEAEVFGHARGAFTGSVGERIGLFEQADGGTLFLDEVGELPLSEQAKLLRVLETGQFRRVGGRRMRSADVRIICATNRHLWDSVKEGRFREDLYYRIACLTVRMPGLRERIDDIEVLAHNLLESIGESMRRQYRLTEGAVARLKAYSFPGNIRELRNILFVAVTRSTRQELDGAVIDQVIDQLKGSRATPSGGPDGLEPPDQASTTGVHTVQVTSLQENEARHVASLLQQFNGNRRQVAASLGISERTLYRKLRKYSLS
jgi:two-component system, NtrC family, response regulator AtoC